MSQMNSLYKRWHRPVCAVSTLCIAIAITYLSLKSHAGPPALNVSDKIQHAIAYCALAAPLTIYLGKANWLRAFIIAVAYGLLMEGLQSMTGTGRTASWLDALANAAGASIGCYIAWLFLQKSRFDT